MNIYPRVVAAKPIATLGSDCGIKGFDLVFDRPMDTGFFNKEHLRQSAGFPPGTDYDGVWMSDRIVRVRWTGDAVPIPIGLWPQEWLCDGDGATTNTFGMARSTTGVYNDAQAQIVQYHVERLPPPRRPWWCRILCRPCCGR